MNYNNALFLKSVYDILDFPQTNLPQIVFAGRSNVGKSSLINYLTGKKNLAKTSVTPGKTRLINHFLLNDDDMKRNGIVFNFKSKISFQ